MAITHHQSKISLEKTLQRAISKFFARQSKNEIRIFEIIDIDSQIEIFKTTKLSMFKDKQVYSDAKVSKEVKIFRTCCERTISYTQENETIKFSLIGKEDSDHIKKVELK